MQASKEIYQEETQDKKAVLRLFKSMAKGLLSSSRLTFLLILICQGEKIEKPDAAKVRCSQPPKRPRSAYFLWLNDHRAVIKEDNPGASISEISKVAGQLWNDLEDKTVSICCCSNAFILRS